MIPMHTLLSSIMSHWRFQKLYQVATSAPAVAPAQLSQVTPNKQGLVRSPGALGLILKTSWSSYLVETLELHRGGAPGSTALSRVKSD